MCTLLTALNCVSDNIDNEDIGGGWRNGVNGGYDYDSARCRVDDQSVACLASGLLMILLQKWILCL